MARNASEELTQDEIFVLKWMFRNELKETKGGQKTYFKDDDLDDQLTSLCKKGYIASFHNSYPGFNTLGALGGITGPLVGYRTTNKGKYNQIDWITINE